MSKIEQQWFGKWNTLIRWAREYAEAEHPSGWDATPISIKQMKCLFDEYFIWHEKQVEEGNLLTYGGQPFSEHNRAVCAEKLYLDTREYLDREDWERMKTAMDIIGKDKED